MAALAAGCRDPAEASTTAISPGEPGSSPAGLARQRPRRHTRQQPRWWSRQQPRTAASPAVRHGPGWPRYTRVCSRSGGGRAALGQAAVKGAQQQRMRAERVAVAQAQAGVGAGCLGEQRGQVDLAVIRRGKEQRQDDDAALARGGNRAARPGGCERAEYLGHRRRRMPEESGPCVKRGQAAAGRQLPGEPHQRGDGRGGARIAAAMRHGQQRGQCPGAGLARARPGHACRRVRSRAQPWMPHSVLPVPSQRPLRGSAPGSTRAVQVEQPIDG